MESLKLHENPIGNLKQLETFTRINYEAQAWIIKPKEKSMQFFLQVKSSFVSDVSPSFKVLFSLILTFFWPSKFKVCT